MKIIIPSIIFLLVFVISCEKVGEILDEGSYDKPVIHNVDATPETVNPGDTVIAIVEATNPEKGVLTYSWSTVPDEGQFIQPANDDTVFWIAPFTGDTYTLQVIVENEQKSNADTDEVTVVSSEKPLVNISAPKNGNFFVQNENIDVVFTAYHDNKLSFVRLFVGGNEIDEKNYDSSNNYEFSFKPDSTMISDVLITVIAGAFNQPGNIGADSVTVSIEGILPKIGGN